jgi:nitroreductase
MLVQEAIYGRRSVRSFAPRPVPDEALTALVEAAIQAPSALNEQPWTFHVLRDAKFLSDISDAAKQHLLGVLKTDQLSSHMRGMLTDPQFHIFYHAPAVVVICGPAQSNWSSINCALSAQNFMLSAFAAGLGTCWIGFAQQWLNTDRGRAAIGLDDGRIAVAPLAVGYPAGPAHAVPRRPPHIEWVGKRGA